MNLENGRLYQTIYQRLSAGETMVLATVIDSQGSTPRKAGSRMLIFAKNGYEGSVGGGPLEARVVDQARECIEGQQSRLVAYSLNDETAHALSMHCGGQVEILLEFLAPESEQMDLYARAASLESENKEFWLVADLKRLTRSERKVVRDLVLDEKMAEVWKQAMSREKPLAEKAPVSLTEDRQQLIERMLPREILYIFGAGHVGSETALLASQTGFRVRLVDDRENISRLPELHQNGIDTTILPEFQGIIERLHPNPRAYALIVTRGHLFDQRVLEQLLPLNLIYTGMMGSRKKKAAMFSSMLDKGFPREELDRVYCPVGLEIGAETPAELAVSIVAQLIQIRMGNKHGA